MPPRRPNGAQGTGHALTAATRGPGNKPHPHGGHTRPRDGPRPHGSHTKPRERATPHGTHIGPCFDGGHTGPRRRATPQRRTHLAQVTGTPPRRPLGVQKTGRATTAATNGPGDGPLPRGGHTWFRGHATPPLQLDGAKRKGHTPTAAIRGPGTSHAFMAALRGPGNKPRNHGGHSWPSGRAHGENTGHRGRATPHGGYMLPRGEATPPRRPHGVQGRGDATTAAMQSP